MSDGFESKKILIFSLTPVFKDVVHWWSTKILRQVASYLGHKWHKVNIYCTRREDNQDIFELSENVIIHPILQFKQTFPSPYNVSPHELASIANILLNAISEHDVFYVFDWWLQFSFLTNQSIPTIMWLRDFLYSETLIGGLNFQRDKLLVVSPMVEQYLLYTAGLYMPTLKDRVQVISNGVDTNFFKPTVAKDIFNYIPAQLEGDDFIMLFPHRPDISKWLDLALELLYRLVVKHNHKNVKLLVPRHFDHNIANDYQAFVDLLAEKAGELDIATNIIVHDWIPIDLMPEYYALWDVTLCIGNIVEAYGNTAFESIACGVPAIVSRIWWWKYLLHDDLTPLVEYGDIQDIEERVLDIMHNKISLDVDKIQKYIKQHLSYDKMLEEYEKVLCNAEVLDPLMPQSYVINDATKFILAPWCNITDKGVYHEYKQCLYEVDNALLIALWEHASISTITNSQVDIWVLKELYHMWVLIPIV